MTFFSKSMFIFEKLSVYAMMKHDENTKDATSDISVVITIPIFRPETVKERLPLENPAIRPFSFMLSADETISIFTLSEKFICFSFLFSFLLIEQP